jgi:hypothetical protein
MPPKRTRPGGRYGAEGSVWRRVTAFVVSRDHGICHVCLHPGAAGADHDPYPVTERPDLALDAGNLKAVHTYLKRGGGQCPVCSPAAVARGGRPVYCNEVKQGMSVERARRIISERTGLAIGSIPAGEPGEREWLTRPGYVRTERSAAIVLVTSTSGVR